jgi:hypothetical protein
MVGCLLTTVTMTQTRSAADLYQERCTCRRSKAISSGRSHCRTIVERFASDRTVAAKALVQIGECYESSERGGAGVIECCATSRIRRR